MTGDANNKESRRPPTIELAATEIDNAAERSAADQAEPASALGPQQHGPEQHGAEEHGAQEHLAEEQQSTGASQPAGSRGHLKSHIAGALIGAGAMAAAGAALWFTDVIPAREAKPAMVSNTPAPEPSSPAQSPTPPVATAAAQNNPSTPEVNARLDKIERAIEAQRPDAALTGRIAGLEAQAKSLADGIDALRRRTDDIAATGQSAAKEAGAALNAAEAAKSASDAASKTQVQRSDLDALAGRVMALENTVKGLAAETAPLAAAGADDRAARLTIAAEALRAAVERGAPYQNELAALHTLGVDQQATVPLEAFAAGGVPSAAALARELEALLPSLQAAAQPEPADATFLERLTANAQKLVRITPAGAPPGNDPAAVIARIRFDAAHNNIEAAVSEIDALPDSVKPLAASWRNKAAARAAAVSASRQLAGDALAALGKPPAQ
jgi:hypothetical protein